MASAPPLTERPAPAPPPRRAGKPRGGPPASRTGVVDLRLVAVVALLVAASLPLARVFVGLDFMRPVLAAAFLSIGVAWGARRLNAGPVGALALSLASWLLFVSLAFVPFTLYGGVVPTWDTLGALREVWLRGIELIRTRPAPAFPEAGMLLITATGVWWVAHAVEGLVFRLRAPLRAIAMSLLLWTVPLAMAPGTPRPWLWAVPLLAASAGLLLATAHADLDRYRGREPDGRPPPALGLHAAGWVVAGVAIVAGAALGGLLPGYGERPFYEVRGLGGTTITTNPIVSIRTNLVSQSNATVVEVRTARPVYLRLTALDVYNEREEWTSEGIRGSAAAGRLAPETDWVSGVEVDAEIEVQGLEGAVIVPVPYQPVALTGPVADRFQYDRNRATVTLAAGQALDPGDVYRVQAQIPEPAPEVLAVAPVDGADPALTRLPDGVPDEVAALARQIVDDAGAVTPFEQALAIQQELRRWNYSLDPPQGHSGSAMLSFISNRVGYCEQFAGTMAVMLRTLGIPARVAVGFTPGDVVGADDGGRQHYLVRSSNAHAWVEVLFPGLGWLSFEPTPRSDGNILTPTASNIVPAATDAQTIAEGGITDTPFDDDLFLQGGQQDLPDGLVPPESSSGTLDAGGGGGDGAGLPLGLLAAAVLALAALTVRRRRRRRDRDALVPSAVVLAAVERVRRIGRGLGMPPRASETDREYLLRVRGEGAA